MTDFTPEHLAKIRRRVKIYFAVAVVVGCLTLLQKLHQHFDPMARREYGQLVHVTIGERDFAIPSEYFRGPTPHGKIDRLHLWVMMPDYTPYRGEIEGDRAHIDAGWERHLILDVEDTAHTNDLASRYSASRIGPNSIFKPKDVEPEYGLQHTHVWYSNARSPDPWIVHDLFYENAPNGSVKTFISCDQDQPNTVGVCSFHAFTEGTLIYNISYRKSNLPRWHSIQSGVTGLMKRFACVPLSSGVSTKTHNGENICPR